MPFQIDVAINRFGLSVSQAGIFGFVEILALSVTMFVGPTYGKIFSSNLLSLTGGVVLAVSALMADLVRTGQLYALYAIAACLGVGAGIIFCALMKAVSSRHDIERNMSFINGVGLLINALIIFFSSHMAGGHSGNGNRIFLMIAATALIAAPFMMIFMSEGPHGRHDPTFQDSHSASPIPISGAVVLFLLWAGYSIGSSAMWSFSARIARHINIPTESMANLSSLGIFVGIFASLANAYGTRFISSRMLLFIGLTGTALSCLGCTLAPNVWAFGLGICVYWTFLMTASCYLFSMAAKMDRTGALGMWGASIDRIGHAFGTYTGGLVIATYPPAVLGGFSFFVCIAPVILWAVCTPHKPWTSMRRGNPDPQATFGVIRPPTP